MKKIQTKSRKQTNSEEPEIIENSTTAENVLAWKELLSSKEARDFVATVFERSTVLFGQTHSSNIIQTLTNLSFMVGAFACIGALAYFKLVPEGTIGALAGIVIGYFFKKNG